MTRQEVSPLAELEQRGSIVVEVDGLQIAIFLIDGEVYAVQNVCPHKEGPIYRSQVNPEGPSAFCPWHGWEFDLENGQNPVSELSRLRTFPSGVRDGNVWVEV